MPAGPASPSSSTVQRAERPRTRPAAGPPRRATVRANGGASVITLVAGGDDLRRWARPPRRPAARARPRRRRTGRGSNPCLTPPPVPGERSRPSSSPHRRWRPPGRRGTPERRRGALGRASPSRWGCQYCARPGTTWAGPIPPNARRGQPRRSWSATSSRAPSPRSTRRRSSSPASRYGEASTERGLRGPTRRSRRSAVRSAARLRTPA